VQKVLKLVEKYLEKLNILKTLGCAGAEPGNPY
jgi:hypothetical protein